jgi:hypothetical protein
MRRKLAVTVVATVAAVILAAPFLARHVQQHSGAAADARSGSAIVASRF